MIPGEHRDNTSSRPGPLHKNPFLLTIRPSVLNILAGNSVYSATEEFNYVFEEKWKRNSGGENERDTVYGKIYDDKYCRNVLRYENRTERANLRT